MGVFYNNLGEIKIRNSEVNIADWFIAYTFFLYIIKAFFKEFIGEKKLTKTGEEAIWARYDPPFQLWFLRRNEVLIPIE